MLRWWTGTTWTDQTAPAQPPAASTHPPLTPSWRKVALATQLALGLYIAVAAFIFYVDVQVLEFVDEVRESPESVTVAEGERVDRLLLLSLVELLAFLLTGILFIVWLYTAHHSSRMHRGALKHKSGWAIGGWFVPVLSLWRPYQMVTDVRRGATDRSSVDTSPLQVAWWIAWLLWLTVGGVAGVLYSSSAEIPVEDHDAYVDALGTAASFERFSAVMTVVAALLAILLVRRVTALVMAPPYPHG